jgi:hypothetical protein
MRPCARHRIPTTIHDLEADERSVQIDQRRVLVAISKIAEIDFRGVELMAQVDVVHGYRAALFRLPFLPEQRLVDDGREIIRRKRILQRRIRHDLGIGQHDNLGAGVE